MKALLNCKEKTWVSEINLEIKVPFVLGNKNFILDNRTSEYNIIFWAAHNRFYCFRQNLDFIFHLIK